MRRTPPSVPRGFPQSPRRRPRLHPRQSPHPRQHPRQHPRRERGGRKRQRAREAHGQGQGRAKPLPAGAPYRPRSSSDYSHLCLQILCKSEVRADDLGPAEVRGQHERLPLASMIDDLRACTHKQLPELFPLMASLHPELQLRTPSNSGGRTATWSRRGTASWASCPCPSSTSAAPRRGRCPRCGSSSKRMTVNAAANRPWRRKPPSS